MEIIGKIIDFIKEKWGVRIALETLIFVGGACPTLFLLSHPTTYGQVLGRMVLDLCRRMVFLVLP